MKKVISNLINFESTITSNMRWTLMDGVYILKNIEPFNEMFYRNCFNSSLFHMIKHYNKKILPILVNDVAIYSTNNVKNEKSIFTMNYLHIKSLKYVLDTIGISFESSTYKENIVDNITCSISKQKPVIIFIDSFYEPFRQDTYQKYHLSHTLLVYGYDEREGIMNILEHKHREALFYENRTISYTDIKNAYVGYNINFQDRGQVDTYFEFELKKTDTDKETVDYSLYDYRKVFIQNYKKKEREVFEGLEEIKKFNSVFQEIIYDEITLGNMVDSLLDSFNTIINAKQAELYKISKLFGKTSDFYKMQHECMKLWNLVRVVVAKYKFTNVYKREKFSSLVDKLKTIYDIEYSYYEGIMILSH